jgi:hypothetical protein
MIQPRVSDFIESLQPIASEVSVEAARDLATHFGGTRLYVPRTWRPELDVNAIGEVAAQKLCIMFGPERIDIPRMPFTAEALKKFVDEMRAQGQSNGAIARELGLSWRTVTRLSTTTSPLTGKRRRVLDDRQIDIEELISNSRR